MKLNRGLIFVCIVVLVATFGCADNRRGVMENNLYYSTQSPNVQIKVRDKFKYRRGATGEFRHQFFDNEGHRIVYIHYVPSEPNETQVDYYYHPDQWIYEQFPNSVEIERFEMDMAGEKWYVRDAVRHVSTASCYMFRDLGVFTDMHDVLKLIYFWEMPPFICKDWKFTDSLSDSQQQYLKEFRDGFAEDIEVTNYHSADGEKKIAEEIIYDIKSPLESQRNAKALFAKAKSAYDKRDYKVAFAAWFSLASEGDAESAFLISEMYYWAEGVPENHKEATRWCLEAANRGHGKAQCQMGFRYPDHRNDPNAYLYIRLEEYKWLWLCGNNKDVSDSMKKKARYRVNQLSSILSEGRLEYAEIMAKEWRPQFGKKDENEYTLPVSSLNSKKLFSMTQEDIEKIHVGKNFSETIHFSVNNKNDMQPLIINADGALVKVGDHWYAYFNQLDAMINQDVRDSKSFQFIKVGLVWYYERKSGKSYWGKYEREFADSGTLQISRKLDRGTNFNEKNFWIKLNDTPLRYSSGLDYAKNYSDVIKLIKPYLYVAFHSTDTNYILSTNKKTGALEGFE